jgi:hypothetical protein
MARKFPNQQPGLNYLTEGGQETEILYKYGFELQQFAMFPLLDNPRAVTELRGMYGRYLDTAARDGFGVVMGGLDYGPARTGVRCSAIPVSLLWIGSPHRPSTALVSKMAIATANCVPPRTAHSPRLLSRTISYCVTTVTISATPVMVMSRPRMCDATRDFIARPTRSDGQGRDAGAV